MAYYPESKKRSEISYTNLQTGSIAATTSHTSGQGIELRRVTFPMHIVIIREPLKAVCSLKDYITYK